VTARAVGRYRWLPAGLWEVEAAPDVMIRIKRIFPRVAATTRGTVTLTSTLEVARDLEWLIDRLADECQPARQAAAARDGR
jgi:hypothetical protein